MLWQLTGCYYKKLDCLFKLTMHIAQGLIHMDKGAIGITVVLGINVYDTKLGNPGFAPSAVNRG